MTSPTSLTHATRSRNESLVHTDYAKSSRELIDIVALLRSLGAHMDLELPRIVVIGNQSAGKSSLVEAISGISVPRDAGTCTRCPMECRLSRSSGSWSCQIKIRWEYAATGSRRSDVEEVNFGDRLHDKRAVELALRQAQAAVLNRDAGVPLEAFLQMDERALKARAAIKGSGGPAPFSRNVVCVELAGPELTDLSFVDLPGIVQNADDDVVQLVEDLVKSYISGDKSLILVTLPVSDDIENQKAARLAKQVDPTGSRTIGVLTKPDTLTQGSTKARALWLDILEGRRHALRHGYYCTRQPDDDERTRGVSGAEARTAEMAFFADSEPWKSSAHRARLGTAVLVQNISKLLTEIIRTSLPTILSDVTRLLSKTRADLHALPPPVGTDPGAYVLDLVMRFCAEVAEHVRGSPERAELVQGNRRAYDNFKVEILGTSPAFVPAPEANKVPKEWKQRAGLGNEQASTAEAMYLEDMRMHIKACVTRELPNNVPYAAKRSLIHRFQETWPQVAQNCFEEVRIIFQGVLEELSHSHFGSYDTLKAAARTVIAEELDARAAETIRNLKIILKLEAASPFTLDTHYLAEKRHKHLSYYKDVRAGRVSPEIITSAKQLTKEEPAPATPKSFEPFKFAPTMNLFAPHIPPPSSQGTPFGSNAPIPQQPVKPFAPAPAQPFSTTSLGFGGPQSKSTPQLSPSSSSSSTWGSTPHTSVGASGKSSPNNGENTAQSLPKASAEQIQRALSALADIGISVQEADLGKLHPPDAYEEELELMAEVRAYFDVSFKRIVDYIPLSIDEHFLYAFSEALQVLMFEKLGLGSDGSHARCEAYIAEDPHIVAKREEVMVTAKRLETVQKALLNFGS